MANIDHYLEEIELASRGEEVRDSIIDAFEALNSEGPGTMDWDNITDTPDTLTGYGVSDVPASMVSGVLALNNIPPSALERVVPVADDTARFALTSSDVQNGDTVKVLSTLKLYLVVDDTSLSTEAGYEEYKAGTADSVDWSGVLNTPDTLAGYGIEDAYTKYEVDTSLAAKSDKATTYTKSDVDAIVNTDDDTSEAGNPIAIETDAAQYAKNTHLTLEPVQDLHGYDHPWPAGGGKNLFDKSAVTNGYYIESDGTITGTSGWCVSDYMPVTEGNYIASGYTTSGSGVYLAVYNTNKEYIRSVGMIISAPTTTAVTISTGEAYVRMSVRTLASEQNTAQFEKGSTATSYEPYSNICPISGVDEVEVRATGKNLFDPNAMFGSGVTISDGKITLTAGTAHVLFYEGIPLSFPKDKQLTLSMDLQSDLNVGNNNSAGLMFGFIYSDGTENRAYALNNTTNTQHIVCTSASGKTIDHIYASYGSLQNNVWNITNLQLEFGSTATDYEPYHGTEVTSSLPTTIYGGTLDLETGEVVVDKASWSANTSTMNNNENYPGWTNCGIANIVGYGLNNTFQNMVGSIGTSVSANTTSTGATGTVFLNTQDYGKTQTEWKSLAVDVQFIFPLATPITYQLTPQQLALFKGINNVSTNAKTVQVTYRNGELATTGDIVTSTEVAKHNAIGESASYTDARLATELAPILGNFATAETSPTSASHAVGEYLLYNNRLYKVLAAISAGQQLTIGTNIGQTSVAAELTSLEQRLQALEAS